MSGSSVHPHSNPLVIYCGMEHQIFVNTVTFKGRALAHWSFITRNVKQTDRVIFSCQLFNISAEESIVRYFMQCTVGHDMVQSCEESLWH